MYNKGEVLIMLALETISTDSKELITKGKKYIIGIEFDYKTKYYIIDNYDDKLYLAREEIMSKFKLSSKEDFKEKGNNKLGTIITLRELDNNTQHEIIVDENIQRVKQRLIEQYYGDERDGIYLTRGMTNIDINTKGDIWDINQEDFIWYTFSKEDVINVVNNN